MADQLRTVLWVGVPFAVYIAVASALMSLAPWRPAFDDAFHIADGIHWMNTGTLDADGLFLRVPLWSLMLGTQFTAFGVRAGLFLLQAWIVLSSFACFAFYNHASERSRRSHARDREAVAWSWALAVPLAVFTASPQLILYSRHAVNELWIGLLAMAVMLFGSRLDGTRALAMGAVVAAAGMTKIVAFALIAPAFCYLAMAPRAKLRLALLCLLGFALVAAPLYWLHYAQRGIWLIDNTGAYQLSTFTLPQWRAFEGAEARYAAGLSSGWELIRSDPQDYLRGFAARAGSWLLRPSSADFASFFPSYPHTLIRIADAFSFSVLGSLALLGTTRRNAPIWLFALAVWFASTFPLHTPYTPKLILLFPWLMLAPGGLMRLRDWRRARGLRASPGATLSERAAPAPTRAGADR